VVVYYIHSQATQDSLQLKTFETYSINSLLF
jgi:hypothetical protein